MLRPSPNHGTQRLPNDDDDVPALTRSSRANVKSGLFGSSRTTTVIRSTVSPMVATMLTTDTVKNTHSVTRSPAKVLRCKDQRTNDQYQTVCVSSW